MLVAVGCSLVEGTGEDPAGDPVGDPGGNASTGTVIIAVETDPAGQAGTFQFTGVPSGTVSIDATLVVADLEPGTYTTTQVDPAPDFDVTAVRCEEEDGGLASSGDPQTRTAVLNLDAGETIQCTFTNTQRGAAVVVSGTIPDEVGGQFLFTGVPSGTIPADGTLVVADLPPGTYTTTEADPAPQFDLVAVSCDDGGSATVSGGDPTTRSAIFNIDPGEMVTCEFTNARRGAIVVAAEVTPESATGSFQYTGVPSGTISAGGTLVVADLPPGTYTTTEVDPAPDFELTEVVCDDGASTTASSGDPQTRTAIFNLEAGETVRCTFSHEAGDPGPITGGDGTGSSNDGDSEGTPGDGTNPFDDPDGDLADFPLPDELPADAGSYDAPKPGPWEVTNFAGQLDCGALALDIPASPPERGTIEVLDGGRTVVGRSLQEDEAPITLSADPEIIGRYTGAIGGTEQGIPVTINYSWQVVTDEYVVGYLTASFTDQGGTCTVYRSYELRYVGD
jgi:hypothetical protein